MLHYLLHFALRQVVVLLLSLKRKWHALLFVSIFLVELNEFLVVELVHLVEGLRSLKHVVVEVAMRDHVVVLEQVVGGHAP